MIFLVLFLFESSNGSNNLILQSCKEASKSDPNLSYDFCVDSLNDASNKTKPPSNPEDLVGMSIQLTKSNGTNMLPIIKELLKNLTSDDQYVKACLQDCFDLYKDSLSSLEDAAVAFKSKDLYSANINLSASLDDSITCEDQFKDKTGKTSPLTWENHVYFQLNVMCLSFVQMLNQH